MNKKFMRKAFYILPVLGLLKAGAVKAICPLCTVTVIAATGLSRWLGIDDVISGLWIGGVTVSLIVWTLDYLGKKDWRFKYDIPAVSLGYYILIYASLLLGDLVFHPKNTLWGIDKLILGTIIGSIFFLAAVLGYEYLKKKNDGKAHFPYEKVALPVGALLALSGVFYLITK